MLDRLGGEEGVHTVLAAVEAMESAIVNREDFEDVVSGGSGRSAPAPDENQMMDIFDEIDADGTGFAQRLDLKNRIAEIPNTGRLVDALQDLSTVIVERADFQAMLPGCL